MGSALRAAGEDVTEAANWLAGQQLTDGGFPAELGGSTSDVLATSEAMFLATGKTALDASLKLSKCPKNPKKLPAATTSCTGVWVVVDRGNGQETVRCATRFGNGVDVLRSAGLTVGTASGFVNRIHGFPTIVGTNATGWWSYWHAAQNSDGTWTAWAEYPVGAAAATPVKGEAEGWYFKPLSDWTSASSLKPPLGYSTSSTPTITGTTQVARTLTMDAGTWTPTPDKVSIRWYRSGTAIKGATKPTYVLTSKDYKKVITVKVTASKNGYQTVSKISPPTAKVTK